MGTFIASMMMTLDGFDGNVHFAPTAEAHQAFNDLFAGTAGMVCDRDNYEILLPYWDVLDLDDPEVHQVEREFAEIFRTMPRYVVDDDIELDDPLASRIAGDPVPQLRTLKASTEDALLVAAGPALLATLFDRDLVDEVDVMILPVVAGDGTRQVAHLAHAVSLSLATSRSLPSGEVVLRYQVRR